MGRPGFVRRLGRLVLVVVLIGGAVVGALWAWQRQLIYFPDAEGNSRWALAQTGDYQPGVTLPLLSTVSWSSRNTLSAPSERVTLLRVEVSPLPGRRR